MLGRVCKSLFDSVNTKYVIDYRFIKLRGIEDFERFNKEKLKSYYHISGSAQDEHYWKIGIYRHIYAKRNMRLERFRRFNITFKGHKDKVTTVDCRGDYLVTGANDNKVKLWNLRDRKCKTFENHKNWITDVKLMKDYVISGAADNHVRIFPIDNTIGKQSYYKHPGFIKSISELKEDKILSFCNSGQ